MGGVIGGLYFFLSLLSLSLVIACDLPEDELSIFCKTINDTPGFIVLPVSLPLLVAWRTELFLRDFIKFFNLWFPFLYLVYAIITTFVGALIEFLIRKSLHSLKIS